MRFRKSALVGRRFIAVLALIAVSPAPTFAGDMWPWSSQTAPAPPPVQPFEIPTFTGNKNDYRTDSKSTPWTRAPRMDGDAIFRMIVACYPSKSQWNIDIDLQAAVRNGNMIDVTGTAIGQQTIGIVARMPLYSATEIDREREREARRRKDTAAETAKLVGAVAERNQAARIVALAGAMERRAQVRVGQGIADSEEQVKYLEKVADQETKLITAETRIMDARLSLVAYCRDDKADEVNAYLSQLVQLPEGAKP